MLASRTIRPFVPEALQVTRLPDAGHSAGHLDDRGEARSTGYGSGQHHASVVGINFKFVTRMEVQLIDHADRKCYLAFAGESRETTSPELDSTLHE